MNDFLTYLYLVVIGLSFLSSLVSFRLDFSFPLKFFSILLVLTFFVELGAILMMKHHHNNTSLYNIFMLVEFWVYGYYYRYVLTSTATRKLISVYLLVYPVFWAVVVFFIFGIGKWNSYVVIFGSFFTILFSAAYYRQLFRQEELVRLHSTPEFWIATALIIFYSCNLPYMGMLNFLVRNYLDLAVKFLTILKILNVIMYSLFIYAYLCTISTRKS